MQLFGAFLLSLGSSWAIWNAHVVEGRIATCRYRELTELQDRVLHRRLLGCALAIAATLFSLPWGIGFMAAALLWMVILRVKASFRP